ncbi:MAG: MotA/TolQ/ExbB proton channel family protein [Methylococcales bacterium]|nr:MotA/TolQ/ExbB proton channel family protein [Methylococcales bacterium]
MNAFNSFFDAINNFLEMGGTLLTVILWVSILLWTLIIERLLFFKFHYPELRLHCLESWEKRHDKTSKKSLFIRKALLSEAKISMNKTVPIIKMLIALCPLLGLLGTVTGMISVFDVLAITGTGNARAMASGISQATVPTMAGMVIAISGLYFSKIIQERISDESHHLADLLKYHSLK